MAAFNSVGSLSSGTMMPIAATCRYRLAYSRNTWSHSVNSMIQRVSSVNNTITSSPRGQVGLEAKILSSASDSASKNCPRPRAFVLGMSNFLSWPRENECNDGTCNQCEFAM